MNKVALLILLIFFILLRPCRATRKSVGGSVSSKTKLISVKRFNDTSIRVDWRNFESSKKFRSSLCPANYYVVVLNSTRGRRSWRIIPPQSSLFIDELTANENYLVKFMAHTCHWKEALSSKWYKVPPSAQQRLLRPPSSVTALSYENNIFVKWSPAKTQQKIEGYIVSYGEGVPDVFFKLVPPKQTNATLSDLKFSTDYTVGVRTYRKFKKSEAIYKILRTQSRPAFGLEPPKTESSILLAPTNLRLKTLSARSVLLQWNDPSLFDDQKIVDERFYGVHYSKVNDGENVSVVVKALQVTIHGLESNQWYKFKVRTVKGVLISPFTEEILGKTLRKDSNFPSKKSNFDGKFYVEKFATKTGKAFSNHETKSKRHQRPTIPEAPLQLDQQQPDPSFAQQVQIKVNALVTWPKFVSASSCLVENATYLFKYKMASEPDEMYISSNLTFNYKLIEGLNPLKSYKYQVIYLSRDGVPLLISQENTLNLPLAT